MKNLISVFSILFAAIMCFTMSACENKKNKSTDSESAAQNTSEIVITEYQVGTHDGYDYELWKNDAASGTMTLGEGGAFTCQWYKNGSGSNILFRSGRRFGSTHTFDQVGDISIKYTASYYNTTGTSYLSVYGWLHTPDDLSKLVEYYIVDNYYGDYHPGRGGSAVPDSKFEIPGEGTYNVYTRKMFQQSSVAGPDKYDFTQYISVRTEKRLSGTISVTEHFKKWKELGLDMSGNLYEAMMKIEGYESSGSAGISENVITIK